MIRAVVLAGLAGLLPAAGAPAAQEVTRQVLTSTAERILVRESALTELWPGFWPEGQPFILYSERAGSVWAGGASPAGPEFRSGVLPGARSAYELDYPSGAPNTVALRLDEADTDLSTLFHEQFHDYQSDAFRWIGPGAAEFVDLTLIGDRASFAARAEIERWVLADALTARDAGARRRFAAEYLILRKARLGSLDAAVATTEAHREWTEGTAEYVGLQGAALVAGNPRLVRSRIVEGLKKDLASGQGGFTTNWFRWRAYGVGAALAWLLDDTGTVGWRERVSRGEQLDVLLDETIGPDASTATAAELLAARGFDGLAAGMGERLAKAPAAVASREEFLASAPHRLVIELDGDPAALAGMEMSFQSPAMSPLPNGALALPEAALFSTRFGAFELNVSNHSILTETHNGRQRYVILLKSFDTLGEFGALPTGTHVRETLRLDRSGIELSAGHTTVEVTAEEIVLRVRP